jgi:hypothetical protein
MNDQQFVSEKRAADILGLSRRTLLQWRLRGSGPVACRFGRAVRYSLTDLEEFATRSRASSGGAE